MLLSPSVRTHLVFPCPITELDYLCHLRGMIGLAQLEEIRSDPPLPKTSKFYLHQSLHQICHETDLLSANSAELLNLWCTGSPISVLGTWNFGSVDCLGNRRVLTVCKCDQHANVFCHVFVLILMHNNLFNNTLADIIYFIGDLSWMQHINPLTALPKMIYFAGDNDSAR